MPTWSSSGSAPVPTTTWPRAAGLACDNGVLVDARLRASDPHVFAAGDVARHDHPLLGRLRVEHWDAAIHQGRAAARAMLGDDAAYDRMPYFFTDQYDLGMEYVGHVGAGGLRRGGDPRRPRGAQASRPTGCAPARVVAGMHLNDWDAIDTIRSVVGGPATSD